jgi:iron complex transport system permease protein
LGESEARHLGIDVQRVKKKLILLTTLGIGTAVAVAGMIGFVGLIVPHIVRLLIGPDHRWLLPVSALAGGILLLIADTLARVIIAPVELPTGILTAILGAPFFIMLLIQQRREF